jgi:cellulose synthase/poly-beta-1,6-N-acetylglucosamine synthase-like glycosyltransferase
VSLLLALLLAPLAILTLCFAIEVLVGLTPLAPPKFLRTESSGAVIVIPAHNEEAVLAKTIDDLKAAVDGAGRILVVADNCTDATAQIARDARVDVLERSDPDRRGKGFALDFARAHLRANPPRAVLIVDADCSIDRESVLRLVEACVATGRPCQATNLQRPNPRASPAVQLSTFAFFIKNVIRQRALKRLAGRVHLLGTGMAFPWTIFDGANLATSAIVEDLKLGQELANSGQAPLFIEGAAVWSRAESSANTISQRRRWEGGFLQNARQVGPRLLAQAIVRANPRLLWAALDLMIPPFALLLLLDVVALALGATFAWLVRANPSALYFIGGTTLLALTALALAWALGGRRFVSLKGLAQAPLYVAWKLPMYVGIARLGAPKEWMRTERE